MAGAVERAVGWLGMGFDVTCDFRPEYCRGKERLVALNEEEKRELVVPGFGSCKDVPADINCDKGDRIRFQSDVLEFTQMSELFNHRSSIAGKIPCGLFNYAFGFEGSTWAQDASSTKFLAIDGSFITLFDLRIERQPLTLTKRVVRAVPSTWDPTAIARFIAEFGTHIITGLSVGGQDVVYVKQDQSSTLSPSELKLHLDNLGDQLFTGACTLPPFHWKSKQHRIKVPEAFNVFDQPAKFLKGVPGVFSKDGVTVMCCKRGGDASASSHGEWLPTVPATPDVINFTFVPITSLLKGLPGCGFLSHAINLYLRYKPPLPDLRYFLDFQCHKLWAPMHNDLPLGTISNMSIPNPSLTFNRMGPRLYVNTSKVIVGKLPVTGMRLHLEGKKNDRLAIHLEHLSQSPTFIGVQSGSAIFWRSSDMIVAADAERYLEPVQSKKFTRVCTIPVKYDPLWTTSGGGGTSFIVTGAQLHVKAEESSNALHLRLMYAEVSGCVVCRSQWRRGPSGLSQKSNFFSAMSASLNSGGIEKEKGPHRELGEVVVDSAIFPSGPPVPVAAQKLLKFVDTTQLCQGPQHSPGHWLVTGAKLNAEKGKIKLHVKFSLLASLR
ncbi:MACPF domain-containing protein At1g14780-like isoform X1 [Zingiber officinale]|uniref:MACPF domain-containing protein At1g14780-like isoform X1 n=1 Tax=Zingiber officinale TaxID=94328 RepID=UPI001C4BF607|nr:MACPF domain-containing protein At1g14780-like isoform X1 [Zingiber officinale]